MISRFVLSSVAAALALTTFAGPSPAPIVVQAMSEVTPSAPVAAVPTSSNQSNQGALKILQEMKAANEALLEKQAASLEQLEEIEKAADQLKIYTKRG